MGRMNEEEWRYFFEVVHGVPWCVAEEFLKDMAE